MNVSGQVGRLCKCYYICIIDNIASDIRSPGPRAGAGVISPLTALAPDTLQIQSRASHSEGLDYSATNIQQILGIT